MFEFNSIENSFNFSFIECNRANGLISTPRHSIFSNCWKYGHVMSFMIIWSYLCDSFQILNICVGDNIDTDFFVFDSSYTVCLWNICKLVDCKLISWKTLCILKMSINTEPISTFWWSCSGRGPISFGPLIPGYELGPIKGRKGSVSNKLGSNLHKKWCHSVSQLHDRHKLNIFYQELHHRVLDFDLN